MAGSLNTGIVSPQSLDAETVLIQLLYQWSCYGKRNPFFSSDTVLTTFAPI